MRLPVTTPQRRAGLALGLLIVAAVAVFLSVWLTGGLSSAGVSSIVVDSAGDGANATPGDATCDAVGGGCTLRAAIDAANSNPGQDSIEFAIPGEGPHTITPGSELPALTETAIIDGYTQPGAAENTLGPKQGTNATLMIEIDGSNAGEEANGIVIDRDGVIVKGLVINRFVGSGILIRNGEDNDPENLPGVGFGANSVQGTFLGTDVSGEVALGNGVGLTIDESWFNLIGGTGPGQNNLISGNGIGIVLTGNSMLNNVRGSIIGAARDGDTPLGNESHGVLLKDGALCNTIGMEFVPGENIISFNGGAAVAMEDDTGINNYVDPNEMRDNGELGIDLGNDGITPNDENDTDSGPNDLQNYPVLTSAVVDEEFGNLVVEGTLDTIPNTFMNLFFFVNEECDPSGHGEGLEFIHSERFNTDATGDREFSYVIVSDVQPGNFITASLSTPESTSEFSACVQVQGSEPQYIQGDTTCDNDVGATDALADLQHVAGLDPGQQPGCPAIGSPIAAREAAGTAGVAAIFGDVDCDHDVDATDALKILQHLAALPYMQNDPCPDIGDPL